jgi:hypothetical protein
VRYVAWLVAVLAIALGLADEGATPVRVGGLPVVHVDANAPCTSTCDGSSWETAHRRCTGGPGVDALAAGDGCEVTAGVPQAVSGAGGSSPRFAASSVASAKTWS